MNKLISYPLSVLYYLAFGLTLVVFHPIQWFCLNVFGYQAHKKSVDYLNFLVVRSLHLLGATYRFEKPKNIPLGHPTIIVANHQSMNDIPPLIWFLRELHPKFISKKELGKGIPSVSFNLRHGGSVLIDRKNAVQSIAAIKKMGQYIRAHKRSVVIFPEGSRSRDGQPKPFKSKGLETLFKEVPEAMVLPVSINNSWKLLRYGAFPMGAFVHLKFKVHPPVFVSDFEDTKVLIETLDSTIKKDLQA